MDNIDIETFELEKRTSPPRSGRKLLPTSRQLGNSTRSQGPNLNLRYIISN